MKNCNTLKEAEVVKQLGNILKTNVRACKALGCPYINQVIIFGV
jgi:exportin-1